ncbi:MAG: rhodanese-like domain-containing protein [Ignavibacteria bacterium]|nr:rhodanese-like domain-containing protein [Ignavibacteria bacterium]
MKLLIIAIILVTVFMAFRFVQQDKNGVQDISVAELKNRLGTDTNLVLIDVRTLEEVQGPMKKLPQAIHIPLNEIEKRVAELEKYKNKEIAVICRSGNRSRAASKILLEHGFTVKNVSGGMLAYTR